MASFYQSTNFLYFDLKYNIFIKINKLSYAIYVIFNKLTLSICLDEIITKVNLSQYNMIAFLLK